MQSQCRHFFHRGNTGTTTPGKENTRTEAMKESRRTLTSSETALFKNRTKLNMIKKKENARPARTLKARSSLVQRVLRVKPVADALPLVLEVTCGSHWDLMKYKTLRQQPCPTAETNAASAYCWHSSFFQSFRESGTSQVRATKRYQGVKQHIQMSNLQSNIFVSAYKALQIYVCSAYVVTLTNHEYFT